MFTYYHFMYKPLGCGHARLEEHEVKCHFNPAVQQRQRQKVEPQQSASQPKNNQQQQRKVQREKPPQEEEKKQLWHCQKRKRDGNDMKPFTEKRNHRFYHRCKKDEVYPCIGIGCQDCPI